MANEERFRKPEVLGPETLQPTAAVVCAEPAPAPKRKGFTLSLSWNFGFEIARPKRLTLPCPTPADEDEAEPINRPPRLAARAGDPTLA
jgi:hypothetical protein